MATFIILCIAVDYDAVLFFTDSFCSFLPSQFKGLRVEGIAPVEDLKSGEAKNSTELRSKDELSPRMFFFGTY